MNFALIHDVRNELFQHKAIPDLAKLWNASNHCSHFTELDQDAELLQGIRMISAVDGHLMAITTCYGRRFTLVLHKYLPSLRIYGADNIDSQCLLLEHD